MNKSHSPYLLRRTWGESIPEEFLLTGHMLHTDPWQQPDLKLKAEARHGAQL